MPSFSIALSTDPFQLGGERVAQGRLNFGIFEETFFAPISYWSTERYLSQWRQALKRLLAGESRSALVTSMHDPQTANFIMWWIMYRIGENVHIQNHCLFLSELAQPFDEQNLYEAVPEHVSWEDGQRISEWVVKLSDIKDYLDSQG